MKARWISRMPSLTDRNIGYAIVASWWPGRYLSCITYRVDTSSDIGKLAYCLDNIQNKPKFHEVPYIITGYVTSVNRCDKYGAISNYGNPLFEKKYANEVEAKTGHEEILGKLAAGKL